MKRLMGSLVLCLALVGTAHAQEDPLHGVWVVDFSKSWGQGLPAAETVTLEISDGVEHATNDITSHDGTRYRSEYTIPYNDGKWHRGRNPETGEPSSGKTMLVRMDERTELRIGQNAEGMMSSMIMRRVSEDGQTLQIVWYEGNGSIHQVLHLDRQ